MRSRRKNGGKRNSIQFELGKKPIIIPTAEQEISFTIRFHDGIGGESKRKGERRKKYGLEPIFPKTSYMSNVGASDFNILHPFKRLRI